MPASLGPLPLFSFPLVNFPFQNRIFSEFVDLPNGAFTSQYREVSNLFRLGCRNTREGWNFVSPIQSSTQLMKVLGRIQSTSTNTTDIRHQSASSSTHSPTSPHHLHPDIDPANFFESKHKVIIGHVALNRLSNGSCNTANRTPPIAYRIAQSAQEYKNSVVVIRKSAQQECFRRRNTTEKFPTRRESRMRKERRTSSAPGSARPCKMGSTNSSSKKKSVSGQSTLILG